MKKFVQSPPSDTDLEDTLVGEPEPMSDRNVPIAFDACALEPEAPERGGVLLLSAVGQTDRGQRRRKNEDRFLALEESGVFVVADGMGGYRGGEVASQIAVDTVEKCFVGEFFPGGRDPRLPKEACELSRTLHLANAMIWTRGQQDADLLKMGTTVVAALFLRRERRLHVAHVGDSRAYRLREGELLQITEDHTMAALGDTGRQAHQLSRALGARDVTTVDVSMLGVAAGDRYLLCSDGLNKMLEADEIQRILADADDPTVAVAELVARANDEGGKDNITVLVVQVNEG